MSARQVNNAMFAALGGSATITTGTTPAQYEIALFTAGGTRMTEALATTTQPFYVAVGGANSKLDFKSDVIKFSDVTRISHKAYSADTQQSSYIGYNGTSGSIEVSDSTLYMIDIYVQEYLNSSRDGRYIKHAMYESDATASQSEIALGLALSAANSFSREAKNVSGDPFMTFKAVCNTALDTNNTMDETVTVTKGQKAISIATDYDYNTGTDLVVGDFIRIADTDTTTATTDAVYKVVSIDANVAGGTQDIVTLDRPYAGTTGTRTHGNNSTQAITAAQGAAANWGVFMTGTAKDHVVGKEFDELVRYEYSLTGFGTSTQTETAAAKGNGTEKSIRDLVWFCEGNQGEIYRMGEPAIHSYADKVDAQAVANGFDVITIEYKHTHTVGLQDNPSLKQLHIIIPELTSGSTAPNYALNATTDDITDCLEQLLAGVPAYTEANSFDGTVLTTADLALG